MEKNKDIKEVHIYYHYPQPINFYYYHDPQPLKFYNYPYPWMGVLPPVKTLTTDHLCRPNITYSSHTKGVE